MRRLVITDAPKARVKATDRGSRNSITPEPIATALGAEPAVRAPSGARRCQLFPCGRNCFGGCAPPAAARAWKAPTSGRKIPMRRSTWQRLEQLARELGGDGPHPSAAQLASLIVEDGVERFAQKLHEAQPAARSEPPADPVEG